MRHMASIGVGNCIGGVHRCGTWPAPVSASSGTLGTAHALAWSALASVSTASIDVAPDQHRQQHRRHSSMRHQASIGLVIVRNPRRGACLGMVGVGVGIDDFPRCGTWPASASASAASINAAPGQHRFRHRREPLTRSMPWHGRRWRQHRPLPHGRGCWAR